MITQVIADDIHAAIRYTLPLICHRKNSNSIEFNATDIMLFHFVLSLSKLAATFTGKLFTRKKQLRGDKRKQAEEEVEREVSLLKWQHEAVYKRIILVIIDLLIYVHQKFCVR
ncbi:PREDICTED: uncharacterized protein LOC105153731 [Acromyrmex echinatior]|uniref:uncharacterized protein LOC105153731 n=1 Tax=Acromyrmex echinatior TaxID=103372 RepID=UPI000580BC83|nr:PREDICTED: uncharacterized protein LOC105153731 [Acromyrmex echinatior]